MNLEKLKTNYQTLIDYMVSHQYHHVTIARFRAEIVRLLKFASSPDVLSYEDYHEKMYGEGKFGVPAWKTKEKRQLLNQIKLFDEQGIFPDNTYHHTMSEESCYNRINSQYRSIVDFAVSELNKRNLRSTTIKTQRGLLSFFFWELESGYGIDDIHKVDSEVIFKYFTKEGRQRYNAATVNRIRRALLDCKSHPLGTECQRIRILIPKPQRVRRIYPGLSDENKKLVEEYILDESNDLSKRDRAIMILIYFTGLRSCDVANLKLIDINWKTKEITLTQSKTRAQWCTKLEPIILNAIYDYIQNERYKVNIPNVFLAADHRYRPVHPGTIGAICTRTMQKAGIDTKSCRCGTHVFRHKVATDMLETGIEIPVISAVLGHTQPVSVNSYLYVTHSRLKECSLSIEAFPYEKYIHK